MLSEEGKRFLAEKAGTKVDNKYCFTDRGLTLIAYDGSRFEDVATHQVAGILYEQRIVGDPNAKNKVITDHGTYEFSYDDFKATNGGDIELDDIEWIKDHEKGVDRYCYAITVPTVEIAKWRINQAVDENGNAVYYARIYIAKKATTDPNDPDFRDLRAYTPEDIIICDGCDCSQFETTNVSCVDTGFGTYTVMVKKEGYKPWLKTRTLNAGDEVEDTPVLVREVAPPEEAPVWVVKVERKPAWIVVERCEIPSTITPGTVAVFKIAIETTYKDVFYVVLEFYKKPEGWTGSLEELGTPVFSVESEYKEISPTDPPEEKVLICAFEVPTWLEPGEYVVVANLYGVKGP